MDDFAGWVWVLIPIIALLGGFTVSIVGAIHKTRIRELRIRERIAMIEKGLVPPPEVDPDGFERAMGRYERARWVAEAYGPSRSAGRHRRVGIVLIGVGVGLMILISSVGAPDEGIGVGGFLCVLGLAFLINSLFEKGVGLPPAPTDAPRPAPPSGGSGPVPPAPPGS